MMRVKPLLAALAATFITLGPVGAWAANEAPATAAAYAPTFVPTKANRLILLDVQPAGKRLVAVGERGVIMISDDGGNSWKGQRAPTTRTLTAVVFSDEKNGVAVGHGGTIVRTTDGGTTWQAVKVPETGPDSMLGAVALGSGRILAYGSFGLFMESTDNGATWQRTQIIDEEFDRHISQIFKAGDKYVLVGESATFAVSNDGTKWERRESPYKGSLFGGLVTKVAPGWCTACAATSTVRKTRAPPGPSSAPATNAR